MKPRNLLWSSLEDVAGLVAVRAEWQNRFACDFNAASPLLLPTDDYAESYPDFDDPFAHYRVVRHNGDDIVGVHSNDGSLIKLTKPELLIYRLDIKRLSKKIAAAFRFDDSQQTGGCSNGPIPIGTFRRDGGVDVPVYFAIPRESGHLLGITEKIALHHDGAFILLAPTSRYMPVDGNRLLKARNGIFLPLMNSICVGIEGEFSLTPWAEQALGSLGELGSGKSASDLKARSSSKRIKALGKDGCVPTDRTWPDPQQNTTAKAWTINSRAFCLSTTTGGQSDGKAEFPFGNGKPTKQMQLMKLLCFMHPKAIKIAGIIEQVYPDEFLKAQRDGKVLERLIKRIRSLVSDIRNKKLAPAGINPEILPTLDIEITAKTELVLHVAKVHKLDDIGFEELAWITD
jgi:hypothetical protein